MNRIGNLTLRAGISGLAAGQKIKEQGKEYIILEKGNQNNEWVYGYRENDRLNGYDPYSNSKSCSELITDSYMKSFLKEKKIAVSRCRAGNVIGGGDFSENRIIPDCVKYTVNKESIQVRNSNSIRPYQHVLEPVNLYLHLAMLQYNNIKLSDTYNIGPNESDCVTTGQIVSLFCDTWGSEATWSATDYNGPHEANFLKLDTSKAKTSLNWKPIWSVKDDIAKTVEWSKAYYGNENIEEITRIQIDEYMREIKSWKE